MGRRRKTQERLPGRWMRDRAGTTLARLVQTSQRLEDGTQLYARVVLLRGLDGGIHELRSPQLWTLAQLQAERVRWYTRRPRKVPTVADL